ncbi:unnamed protein product (macronuclear) [Paramecium tetraurelia]|uniref:Uncharacterized protein n=1 Tax=Paramecium tetraurelia TaxID=5888 RepID=A0C7C6_PARTE|nr:uncharacterized protein GSPATT00035823001 [Paramecium tetraurelia]CAK66693.1 unnamed protein product [Paramecium tetraurelia]|eukprot:XP_001434090.1 hypothetical protein (macronuclear) [Paramecium tetraurelia strain d4-2]
MSLYLQKQKKERIKIQPNSNVNIEDQIVNTVHTNFQEFFDYKKGLCGLPTYITMNNDLVFVGMEYSYIYIFQQDNDFKQEYKLLGKDTQIYRGQVKMIQISNDNQLLLVTYSNNEFVIFSLKSFKEVLQHRYQHLKYAYMVPLSISSDNLLQFRKEQYYEIIIHLENNYLLKVPLEVNVSTLEQKISISIYKFGEPCERQKIKENRHAKVFENDYMMPQQSVIQDVSIMDSCYEEFIQCMDDRESTTSIGSQLDQSPTKKKKNNFFKSIFQTSPNQKQEQPEEANEYVISTQFYLMAVGFANKIQVVKVFFGYKLNQEQSKIQLLLNFQRSDAYIYNLVFNQPQAIDHDKTRCSCAWGLGSFKETNKRYVLLIINWGYREYYAFKVMSSDYKIQVVQGGHFYNSVNLSQLREYPMVCNFITNSAFYSVIHNQQNQTAIKLFTTSQFEYGVPFGLGQILKHFLQEKHISTLQNGQYHQKFYTFVRENKQEITISQSVMDSINDGFQKSNDIILNYKQLHSNLQIIYKNEQCYILNGTELQSIRLKKWDELLYEQSDNNEWERCFQTAVDIHRGHLTLLCNIPENDVQRHFCIKETCCKLALQYLLSQLPNKQLKNKQSVLTIMHFLIQTQNEEYLFESIEDLMVGCGYRDVFYDYLRELLQYHQVSIPYQHQTKVLKMFTEMEDKETCTKLIMSIQNIQRYDPKGLIDFCLEQDLIEPMMHVCSQINDFLTPYLRIITLLSLLQSKHALTEEDNKNITTLTLDQCKACLFNFLSFCFTGQNQSNPESFFTDRQFKAMFKDLFEYLFDLENIQKLFEIDYIKTLEIFLSVFSERIQESFKQFLNEGKEINIEISNNTMIGFLPEILDIQQTDYHLRILSKVYVLIKLAEQAYFGRINNAKLIDEYMNYSCAFSTNVFAICPFHLNINHIMVNLLNYMDALRKQHNTIFDINWILRGRVQKDLSSELVKNEFLHKVMVKVERQFEGQFKLLEELRQKAQEKNWIWMEAFCLIKMRRQPEALYLYMRHPDPLLSERVFTALAVQLKQKEQDEFIQDWIYKNLALLAAENSHKLFQLLYTYKKDDLMEVFKEMKQVGVVLVDQKIKSQHKMDLLMGFVEYLKPRMKIDQDLLKI